MAGSCETCNKAPPEVSLKRCAKCHTGEYCSRECQKAAWKQHKKTCGKASSDGPSVTNISSVNTREALSPPKGCEAPVTKPFTRLGNGTFLHDRPENDVYKLLIDAYRFRVEDDIVLMGNVSMHTGLEGLNRFIDKAEKIDGLLPSWWGPEKRQACGAYGMRNINNFSNLRSAVDKADIIEHYGDPRFPMQLRMLAEAIYGSGPGGQSGIAMREMLASTEGGESQGLVTTMHFNMFG